MTQGKRKPDSAAELALKRIAKRFGIRLRLAREMKRDGYLRFSPEIPEYIVNIKGQSPYWHSIQTIYQHYEIRYEKFIRIYNAGYINIFGLDLKNSVKRYMQRKRGELSVRLLCYLAYEENRPPDLRIENEAANAYLSNLKIDGKLKPPRELAPDLDRACRGDRGALERVARWMRELIEIADCPHGWAFFGLRLALVEGFYGPFDCPIPRLRKWPKRAKLARLLREHHLLRGCVTRAAKPGRRDDDYCYVFHRPGQFWDL